MTKIALTDLRPGQVFQDKSGDFGLCERVIGGVVHGWFNFGENSALWTAYEWLIELYSTVDINITVPAKAMEALTMGQEALHNQFINNLSVELYAEITDSESVEPTEIVCTCDIKLIGIDEHCTYHQQRRKR